MTYPYTIDNGHGERITFLGHRRIGNQEILELENVINPACGPPIHRHLLQDESLTVVEGKLGAQIGSQQPKYLDAGATITFERGEMHRFWNAGTTPLRCKGKIWPPYNVEYFLTALYESSKASKVGRPAPFDVAYLLSRYKTEFRMGLPLVVQKFVFPLVLLAGYLGGKHKKYRNAPPPAMPE